MATSAKKIAANQANAAKSTGPRDTSNSRFNATKHGLAGQIILRTKEEAETYNTYSARLLPDLSPANAIEQDFAERIVFDSWRVHKAGVIEQNLYATFEAVHDTGDLTEDDALNQAAAFEKHQKAINLISLYQQRLERGIHRNLDMLRKMQKERKAEAALVAKRAPQTVEKPTRLEVRGFVLTTPPQDPAPPPVSVPNAPEKMAA